MISSQTPLADQHGKSGRHYYLMFWGMIFFFIILGLRLWYLQIIKGEELRRRSESNRTEMVEMNSVRGLVQDRHGLVLLDNRASFDLCLKKSEVKDVPALLAELAHLTGRSDAELAARYEALPPSRQAVSVLIRGLTREQLVAVESRRWRLPGVSIQVSTARAPLSDVLASHVLGYMGQIGKRQLESERQRIEDTLRDLNREGEKIDETVIKTVETDLKPHRPGDLVGQSGVEQSMEWYLQGRRGTARREVDSRGRILRETVVTRPGPGYNIRLTLDSRLQALAQSLLAGRAGSIVMMDPRNFEILAMASSPTFSLNDFVEGISSERWKSLQNDPFLPMTNRAVAGQYSPGSTFKMVVALAALADGLITPETIFHCRGSLKLGDRVFNCHNKYGHGAVNLRQSLKVSCDVYYYEVGRKIGADRLAQLARDFFGLGRKTGVDLPAEQTGLMPDSDWLKRRYQKRWSTGDTLPMAIGQGYLTTTPLQVAQFTAVVANGGLLYRPHLVKEVLDVNGAVVKSFEPELVSKIKVAPAYLEVVKQGLAAVVGEAGGSGWRAALPGVKVSGKTGTTQVVSLKRFQSYAKGKVPYKDRDHAWFTGYAPSDRPEVAVTVLLENTGGGGTFSAPLARQMMAAYFDPAIVAETLPPPQEQPDEAEEPPLLP
ncbi:MAG: penicillin-binding protein 2 [Candidatus Adiutrix sp.]|jgi:penicillin-binding protein 2|nr:penicillin-binding protein 2 [Candidatus Adiutrix sp.]